MNVLPRLMVLNRYYKMTRFYDFLKELFIKTGIALGIFVLIFVAFDRFIFDTQDLLHLVVTNCSSWIVFSVFFTSEIIMGLVPPEFFIAWGASTVNPWLIMFLLASVSYLAGVVMYLFGNLMLRLPSVKKYIDRKLSKHIVNLRKWGGFFIFIGAIFPVPHAAVSFTSGVIKFNFKRYLAWALFRYLRFFIFAFLVLNIF